MKIIDIKKDKDFLNKGLKYIQSKWASDSTLQLYDDCIKSMMDSDSVLPRWFLLVTNDNTIIGCVGLITNDFISRMDLWPWLCALYIDEDYRKKGYSKLLLSAVENYAKAEGFKNLYLCTDHIGYYEKYDYKYLSDGYHPWGESSRIYYKEV